MPSAREIAEERFAKGEISETEFNSIVSKLAQSPSPPQNSIGDTIMQYVGGAIAIGVAIFFFSGSESNSASDIKKTNILNHDNKITLDISNSGSKTGDVIIYARTLNGTEEGPDRCIHIFKMQPGTIERLTIPCPRVSGSGKYAVYHGWADSEASSGLVPLAERINVNW